MYLVPTLAFLLTTHPSLMPNDLENVRISFLAGGCTPVTEMEKLISLSGAKMRIRHGIEIISELVSQFNIFLLLIYQLQI